jgi:hypothetical protein
MKTLAQQYQDLLNFIDSAHSLKLSDIANICENATMEFCQNLPSEFDYKVSYSEYDESVEIVANVKGQSEKTFSVTKGMIARLNTNDCYFAQCLSSYKEQEEEVYTDLRLSKSILCVFLQTFFYKRNSTFLYYDFR